MRPMNRKQELDLVEQIRQGDKAALRELVDYAKDVAFNVAIRMLGNPPDAEDATQEILIRLVSGLASFRGESSLRTWVYRVASNHLLTTKQRRVEEAFKNLDEMEIHLHEGMKDPAPPVENQILIQEAKIHCTSHMMLGMDRDHRLAFILGEILDLSAEEGAAVLEIGPDAFRKRLSRARQRMAEFASAQCGIVDPSLPCRCAKQIAHHIAAGNFDPKARPFTSIVGRERPPESTPPVEAIDTIRHALSVFRSHPDYAAPEATTRGIRELLSSSPFAS